MPRSNHPIDAVQKFFRTADLPAAELALHVARGIVKDRKDVDATRGPVVHTVHTGKTKTKPGPKPKAKAKPAPQTGQTVEQPGELVGAGK